MAPRGQIDEAAALELSLFIDNDSEMYRRRSAFVDNMKRKLKSGKYDHSKSPALWKYYVEEGARRYSKDYGAITLNVPTRMYMAKQYADVALANIKSGEW